MNGDSLNKQDYCNNFTNLRIFNLIDLNNIET